MLNAAYAEGRLDHDELQERSAALAGSKTLGELTPLVTDLVPSRTPAVSSRSELARATPADLERMARDEYASDLRDSVMGFLGISLVCWVIWLVITGGGDSFPWPVFPTIFTFLNVVRTVSGKSERIRGSVRKLEKKQRRALKPPEQPMGDDDD